MVQTIESIYQLPIKYKSNIKKQIVCFLGSLGATLGIEAFRYGSVFEEIVKRAEDYGFFIKNYNIYLFEDRIVHGGLTPEKVGAVWNGEDWVYTNKFNLDELLWREGSVGIASGLLAYVKKLKKIAPVLAGVAVGEMLKMSRIAGIDMNFYHVNPGDPSDITDKHDPLIYVASFHYNIAGTNPLSFLVPIGVGLAGVGRFGWGLYKDYKRSKVPNVDYEKLGELRRLMEGV